MQPRIMMTVLALALSLAACSPASGTIVGSGKRGTETRSLASFSQVIVEGAVDVNIRVGESPEVTLEADDNLLEYMESNVQDGKLTLRTRPGVSLAPNAANPVTYNLTVTTIDGLEASGSSSVVAEGLAADAFALLTSGSVDITLNAFTAQNVQLDLSGESNVRVNGEAQSLSVEADGSIELEAREFVTQNANITVNGEATAYANASQNLNANVNGSGTIYTYGTGQVNANVNGDGEVLPGE